MKEARKWPHVLVVWILGMALIHQVMSTPYSEIGSVSKGIVLVFLFVAAFLLESRYLPYVGLMPSIVFLFLLGEPEWRTLPFLLKAYIEAGVIVVFLTYMICHTKNRYRIRLNQASFILYSLKTVFPIYISHYVFGSYSHPYFIYSFVFFFVMTWLFYLKDGY